MRKKAKPIVDKPKLNIDLGHWQDPIRQQGRDPLHDYQPPLWYVTPQACDRSRRHRRPRIYHAGSYQTTSGHTPDHYFEQLAVVARELEEAGINLGWGFAVDSIPGSSRVPESVEADQRRRYQTHDMAIA